MRTIVALCLLTLGACSHTYDWQKPGSADHLAQDDYECRKEAYATAQGLDGIYGASARVARDQFQRCMAARGYKDGNR